MTAKTDAPEEVELPPACEECPMPITAWTSSDEGRSLAEGLNPNASPAEWAFARISRLIEDMEKQIDPEQEVAANLVGAPGGVALRIDDVGYWAPDLVMFYCETGDGRRVRIVQHYTQLSVALSAQPKPPEAPEPRRIGFQLRERLEKAAAEGAEAPKADKVESGS